MTGSANMVDKKESAGGSRTRSKEAIIESYLEEGAKLRMPTMALREQILRASDTMAHAFRSGGKLLTFGNGGSAEDAQHIAAEFNCLTGRHTVVRPANRSLPKGQRLIVGENSSLYL